MRIALLNPNANTDTTEAMANVARAVIVSGGALADAAHDLAATSLAPLIQPIPAAVAAMRRRLESLENSQ